MLDVNEWNFISTRISKYCVSSRDQSLEKKVKKYKNKSEVIVDWSKREGSLGEIVLAVLECLRGSAKLDTRPVLVTERGSGTHDRGRSRGRQDTNVIL